MFSSLLCSLEARDSGKKVATKFYRCSEETGTCELSVSSPGIQDDSGNYIGQSTCLMICNGGSIWPYPTGEVAIKEVYNSLDTEKITFTMPDGESHFQILLNSMRTNFLNTLSNSRKVLEKQQIRSNAALKIVINIVDKSIIRMTLGVDESYSLTISNDASNNVVSTISAHTIFGARNGLETLSQLIAWDDILHSVVIASAVEIIDDRPLFPYRGIMIDTSRSFIPIELLESTVRAMSYNKMNVLHLHVSDTASFPVEIFKQPNVTFYGSYGSDKFYSQQQLADFVTFANTHGIMVLPEIDGPAHVSSGFEWGSNANIGDLIICADPDGSSGADWMKSGVGPPTGQINLGNENFYTIIEDVYDEIASVFTLSEYFHVGGDEIIVGSDETSISCYNNSAKANDIINMLENNGYDRKDSEAFYSLWHNYTGQVSKLVSKAFEKFLPLKKLFIWGGSGDDSSGIVYNLMTREDVTSKLPPSQYNVQVWDNSASSLVPELTSKGYDVILSNSDYVYLDCGAAGWAFPGGYWCGPYHEWQHIYNYANDVFSKWNLTSEQISHVLGSETLAWGEIIDESNLELKLWPRTAALAEALWGRVNEKKTKSWYSADPRMQHWRSELVQRGVQAEPLQTFWCQQREAYACTVDSGIPQ